MWWQRARSAGGRDAPAGCSLRPAGSSALAPGGARRAAARALPRAPPVTSWPPSRRQPRPRGNGHPPGAPVLTRARSSSRARAVLASHAMALRATLDCDLPQFTLAPVGWMARSGDMLRSCQMADCLRLAEQLPVVSRVPPPNRQVGAAFQRSDCRRSFAASLRATSASTCWSSAARTSARITKDRARSRL